MTSTAETHFINGKKACKVIGILVLVIGFVLFFSGFFMVQTGKTGIKRYQMPSGKFIRSISSQDTTYFRYMKISLAVGRILRFIGFLILFVGGWVTARPEILLKKLNSNELEQVASERASPD